MSLYEALYLFQLYAYDKRLGAMVIRNGILVEGAKLENRVEGLLPIKDEKDEAVQKDILCYPFALSLASLTP